MQDKRTTLLKCFVKEWKYPWYLWFALSSKGQLQRAFLQLLSMAFFHRRDIKNEPMHYTHTRCWIVVRNDLILEYTRKHDSNTICENSRPSSWWDLLVSGFHRTHFGIDWWRLEANFFSQENYVFLNIKRKISSNFKLFCIFSSGCVNYASMSLKRQSGEHRFLSFWTVSFFSGVCNPLGTKFAPCFPKNEARKEIKSSKDKNWSFPNSEP